MSKTKAAWTACLAAALLVLLTGVAACGGSSGAKKGTSTLQLTPSSTLRVTPIDPTVRAANQATATADDATHQSYDAANRTKENNQRATERAQQAAQSTAEKATRQAQQATQQAQKTQQQGGP